MRVSILISSLVHRISLGRWVLPFVLQSGFMRSPRILPHLWLSLLLIPLVLFWPISEIRAQDPTATIEPPPATEPPPVPTATWEPMYSTSTPRPTLNYVCPVGYPAGYGTITPDPFWLASCRDCLQATPTPGGPTATPVLTPTVTPTQWGPTSLIYDKLVPGTKARVIYITHTRTTVAGAGGEVGYTCTTPYCGTSAQGYVQIDWICSASWEGGADQSTYRTVYAKKNTTYIYSETAALVCEHCGSGTDSHSGSASIFAGLVSNGNTLATFTYNLNLPTGEDTRMASCYMRFSLDPLPPMTQGTPEPTATPGPTSTPNPGSICNTIPGAGGSGSGSSGFGLPVPRVGPENCVTLTDGANLDVSGITWLIGMPDVDYLSVPYMRVCVRALQFGILDLGFMQVDLDSLLFAVSSISLLFFFLRE